MATFTKENDKLTAACNLLRTLTNREDDDAPGIMDKAIINSSVGLIEEAMSSSTNVLHPDQALDVEATGACADVPPLNPTHNTPNPREAATSSPLPTRFLGNTSPLSNDDLTTAFNYSRIHSWSLAAMLCIALTLISVDFLLGAAEKIIERRRLSNLDLIELFKLYFLDPLDLVWKILQPALPPWATLLRQIPILGPVLHCFLAILLHPWTVLGMVSYLRVVLYAMSKERMAHAECCGGKGHQAGVTHAMGNKADDGMGKDSDKDEGNGEEEVNDSHGGNGEDKGEGEDGQEDEEVEWVCEFGEDDD